MMRLQQVFFQGDGPHFGNGAPGPDGLGEYFFPALLGYCGLQCDAGFFPDWFADAKLKF